MSLWDGLELAEFPPNVVLEHIRASFMPYPIMKGVDTHGRAFLAQQLLHENKLRVGFIIQRNETEYEYGLLEKMDIWNQNTTPFQKLNEKVTTLTQELEHVKVELEQVKQTTSWLQVQHDPVYTFNYL